MKNNIIPITALRDTAKIDKLVKESKGPIFVTKNGYSSFVIVPQAVYEANAEPSELSKNEDPRFLFKAEEQQDDPLGFVRIGCSTLDTEVCGVKHNCEQIKEKALEASKNGIKILCFPELSLTGYTSGDMFLTQTLQEKVLSSLSDLKKWSASIDLLFAIGAPLAKENSLYNCAVVFYHGEILGVVAKSFIPNYSEFYEKRYFSPSPKDNSFIDLCGESVPFGSKLIFVNENYQKLKIAVEICEDGWVPNSPSISHSLNGADVILNLSASNEVIGKKEYRKGLVSMNSAKCIAAYCYADAGFGESTSDLVFSGHHIIAENGKVLAEAPLFEQKDIYADIDLEKLLSERLKTTSFENQNGKGYFYIGFKMALKKPEDLKRHYSMNPFIPEGSKIDLKRVKDIMDIQSMGLVKRIKTVHQKKVVVGVSGGLDSTLALLVCVEAFKKLGYDLKGITGVTMPAFGTSKRTHDNALQLCESLGISFREIQIGESVKQHLKDIGHSLDDHNVTYENAQARERTQVLMDLANDTDALMVGTGDLSELCLGWCTYSGDHMSMYGVNASIPKTLVRYLCQGYAELHPQCAGPLTDIVDTPISPELLPTDSKGEIAQLTEDKIGPYELHDFFIYHFLRFGFRPKKIYFLAKTAYGDKYDGATIKKWLTVFFKKFFINEFKRSCLPDGAKVGTVAISPRGDLRMPSDASSEDYIEECNAIEA